MEWNLNIITSYFTGKNILLFFLFCLLLLIISKSKYLNYLDKSLIFTFPLIYIYPSVILHKDIVAVYGRFQTTYLNFILIATYIFLLFLSIYSNYLGIRNIKFLKLANSQLINRIYSTLKEISSNKILGYIICIFAFFITFIVLPKSSNFHFSNIFELLTNNSYDFQKYLESRFSIYKLPYFTLVMSKLFIPLITLLFLKPKYSLIPFFFINILHINMFAERQGLIIITALALVKISSYKKSSLNKKTLVSFIIILLFIFVFLLNFQARNNTIDFNQLLSLKNSFFSIFSSLWGRTILDPYFMLVSCYTQKLGYISAAGILQQLNYYFGIFSPLVFASIHLFFSKIILSPIQINNKSLKLISSFLYLYWIFYIDLISIIPIFIFAISIFPNINSKNFSKIK